MANIMNPEIFIENRNIRQALLEKYQRESKKEALSDKIQAFPMVSSGELIRRRRENRHIRAYFSQTFDYMMEQVQECNCAFALFDQEGCMIRLNGTEETIRWLEKKGIRLGTVWNMKKIGVNAVSVGLRELKSISSVGEENFQTVLWDTAIYFSPLILEEKGKIRRFGGIGMIVPIVYQSEAFMLNTTCLASSLMIRISMAYRTSNSYGADAKGMVLLDINRRNGSVTITHHNNNFFDILKLPRESYQDVYFKPAEEYFDPLPQNKRFWSIVNEMEKVTDYDLTLYVRGKKLDCIISTEPHNEESIKSKGTLLYITTKQQISRQISEKTSNNAILSFDNIIGQSNCLKSKMKKAKLLAKTDSNVMLLGESGVGKDIFAQAIHNMSSRKAKPFIAVNCGALPRDLIASELFGYEGGAFTGAKKQGNIGKFELANGGTLFLDEIGELPLDLQATLLRAVEQKQFMRLGSNKMISADIKIISATNANIQQMIEEKRFRADLFYRLGTMQLFIPPLRERGEDVILLAEHFIKTIATRIGREDDISLSDEAKDFLLSCPWEGNVRELQNLMDCVVQLYSDSVITAEQLMENVNPLYLGGYRNYKMPAYQQKFLEPAKTFGTQVPSDSVPLRRNTQLTASEILDALKRCGNNKSEAAKLLGISRRTLYRYIDKLEI